MTVGLELLYGQQNPAGAAAVFLRVLERNPSHYGATYQLAVSLDRAGKPAEARPVWERMLQMAEQSGDVETLVTVRARLQQVP